MDTAWMGRHRDFVAALVRHCNLSSRVASRRTTDAQGRMVLAPNEWQALEYLLEHPDETENMAYISDRLGIATSTFSRLVRSLTKLGFVEKYQKAGNRKDIVLRITDEGRAYYRAAVDTRVRQLFSDCFASLEGLSDEQLAQVTRAIESISRSMQEDTRESEKKAPPRLIRLG